MRYKWGDGIGQVLAAGTSQGTQGSSERSEAKHTWHCFEILQLLKTNLVLKTIQKSKEQHFSRQ